MFYPQFPLFEEAQADNSAGGGNSQDDHAEHNSEGEQPQDAAHPEAITLDAIKELLATHATALKTDFTKQFNGLDAKFGRQLKTLETKKVDEAKPALAAALATPAAPDPNPYWVEEKEELTKRLTALEAAKDEAENRAISTEIDNKLATALSPFQWREGRQLTVARLLRTEVVRADDGSLSIGNVPLDKYVKERVPREYDGFLVPRDVGGSGHSGKKTPVSGNALDKIRVGMSKEERDAARSELANLAGMFTQQS